MQQYARKLATPITLFVLLGLLCFGAWWGYKSLTKPVPPAPLTPCVTQNVGSSLLSSSVQVRVKNGGYRQGLAASVGALLKAKGFDVITTTNTSERVKKTIIVGAVATDPEVKLVYAFFPGSSIRTDGRADHTVDVLVGTQFTSVATAAPTSIAVPSGKVCLPSPSSSATAPTKATAKATASATRSR